MFITILTLLQTYTGLYNTSFAQDSISPDLNKIKSIPAIKKPWVKHGMRPQDVVILLKICTLQGNDWRFQDIAGSLKISPSEVSESLQRSLQAGLVSESKRIVYTSSILDFLVSGLKYVFPALPGAVVRGIPTAHSAPPINASIAAGAENYVWQSAKGTLRGQAIEPLYKTVPDAVSKDNALYEMLALADVIRIGRAREVNMAIAEFKKRLKVEEVCQI